MSIFSLYGVYRNDNPQKSLFDSGLFFGIACLFFLPAIPIILFLFIFIYSTRSFVLKEYIINIIGVIVPFIFAFAYCYLFDKLYLLNFNYYKFKINSINETIAIKRILPLQIQINKLNNGANLSSIIRKSLPKNGNTHISKQIIANTK